MNSLQKAGWDVEGVEWDSGAAATARAGGHHVVVGDFRNVAVPAADYQLVVLDHVIEHLDDPRSALARVAHLLAPGGKAVIKYPNLRSLGARLFGECWFHWDVPRHLVIPATAPLVSLAETANLHLRSLRSTARLALNALSNSRSYALGRAVVVGHPAAGVTDWILALLERSLLSVGFAVGEEMIACFTRAEDGAWHSARENNLVATQKGLGN